MDKNVFIKLMKTYGDAYVTYISPNSKKEKFNVGTIDLNNAYIQSKETGITVDADKVLMFCWDTDSYRQIDPNTVIRVESLASELEKARVRQSGNRKHNNVRDSIRE